MSPYVSALLAALCWGFAPMFEKTGLQGDSDPTLGVLVRSIGVVLGTLCLLPMIGRGIGARLAVLPARTWFYLGMGGLLASVIGQAFFYRALKYGEMSRVVPIGASYPLIAFVIGLLWFKEPFTPGKAVGVSLVLAGIYFLR